MNDFSNHVVCKVCPHRCSLDKGETGRCLVRRNSLGRVTNVYEGHCSHISLEPIEKRPFFHYKPDTKFLSVGLLGCSFSCDYCQNFTVSQSVDRPVTIKSPAELALLAREKEAEGIAFSFNEPTVHWEYVFETAYLYPTVIKTNGFVQNWVLEALSSVVKAFNVDLKGDRTVYENVCGGSLKPVLNSIKYLIEMGNHVEISLLVMPSILKDESFFRETSEWLAALSTDVPVHFQYLYPFHRMLNPRYPVKSLLPIMDIFKSAGMRYIYVSNVYDAEFLPYRNTHCPDCGAIMIGRQGRTKVFSTECCRRIPVVWT